MSCKSILYLVCLLLIFSCKKEHHTEPDPAPQLYNVKFDVSDFSQTEIPLSTGPVKTTSLKTSSTDAIPVNQLYLLIKMPIIPYVKSVQKGSNGFGVFEVALPAGNYTAAFCGGDTDMALDVSNSFYSYPDVLKDTFFKSIAFSVGAANISQNVQLARKTAQLELNIEDAIPSNVTRIQISFIEYAHIDAVTGKSTTQYKKVNFSQAIAASDIGKVNFKTGLYTLNNDGLPFNVTVDYFTTASATTPASTKVIAGVTCMANKRTTMSGKLFTIESSAFNVSVNLDWAATETINF